MIQATTDDAPKSGAITPAKMDAALKAKCTEWARDGNLYSRYTGKEDGIVETLTPARLGFPAYARATCQHTGRFVEVNSERNPHLDQSGLIGLARATLYLTRRRVS